MPFYVRSGVFTMPEFLERRYSPATRKYLAYISIVSYVLTKISVTLFAGGIVFETLMGIDFWTRCADHRRLHRRLHDLRWAARRGLHRPVADDRAGRRCGHRRRGTIFAGYLKILPLFIFVIPGVIAAALAASGELQLENSDQALPALVQQVLPVGIRGPVVAGLLAALISSLSSVFDSTSTLITWNIYREWKPQASKKNWCGSPPRS